jgi:hypothetical protein
MFEKLLYGTPIGEPDYTEQILSSIPENFEKVKKLAGDKFDRFRVSIIDLSVKPDFTKIFNK